MKILSAIACTILVGSACQAPGAVVPAGSVLTVRTLQAVASIDAPGTAVPVQLAYPVAVNGKVVLPAGTYFQGKVITSRRLTVSPERLTVNLVAVRVGGHDIPVTTTGPRRLTYYIKALHNVEVSQGWDTFAAGKLMQFQLAQPLVI